MEELLDVYDKNGNFVGVKGKSFFNGNNPGVYYKPVWIWFINSKEEILLQKRASTKKHFPNKWDHTVGGYVKSGEKAVDACVREIKEELGLTINKEEFVFVGEFLEQIYWHVGQVYFLKKDVDISKIKLQKEEVAEVKWVSLDELKQVLFSDEFGPFQEDYKQWAFDKIQQELKNKTNENL